MSKQNLVLYILYLQQQRIFQCIQKYSEAKSLDHQEVVLRTPSYSTTNTVPKAYLISEELQN
jgi:hypothetical protein